MRGKLRFFERPGCHLCDEVRPAVVRWARWLRLELEIVDIESDDDLVAAYGLRIPVLDDGSGRVLLEGAFEPRDVAATLVRIRWRRARRLSAR